MFPLFLSFSLSDIGFNYTISEDTVELVYSNITIYPSEISIPEKINIQNREYNVTGLGYGLFQNSSVETVVINNNIKAINQAVFKNCIKLRFIDMKALKIEEIPDHTFENCIALSIVLLPKSIKLIGKYSFYNCSSLETIDINNTFTIIISDYAFANCYKISSFVFPFYLAKIGMYGFYNTSLESIKLPEDIRYLSIGSFSHTKLKNIDISDTLITQIPAHAFEYCDIRSVSIPPSVKTLGDSCFEGNIHFKSMDISYTNVFSINSSAFKGCSSLSSFKFSLITDILGNNCFESTNFTKFETPDSVRHLGDCLFKNCSNLEIADIGSIQFDNVPMGIFWNCPKLHTVKYPRHQFVIKAHAFDNTAFVHIRFPNSLIGIDDYAFANCRNALTIDVSNLEFTLNGTHIFENCINAETVMFTEEDIDFPAYFLSGCAFSRFEFTPNILSIGEGCFKDCRNLKTVNLLRTKITKIPDFAFAGCKLDSLLLPASVSEIGLFGLGDAYHVVYYGVSQPNSGSQNKFNIIDVQFKYNSDMFCSQPVNKVKLREVGENGEELPLTFTERAYLWNAIALMCLALFFIFQIKRMITSSLKRKSIVQPYVLRRHSH